MLHYILTLILMTSADSFSEETNILSKQAFTDAYREYVVAQFPQATVSSEKEMEVNIVLPGVTQNWVSYLDNAYLDYSSSPQALNDVLQTYTSAFRELMKSEELSFTASNILPVIRTKGFYEEASRHMGNAKTQPKFIKEPLTDNLSVYFVFDTPKTMRPMTEKDLKQLNLTRDNLMKLAVDNMMRTIPDVTLNGDPSRFSSLVAGGDYESSLLLEYSIWTKENFPVMGDIVVYPLARDLVLITGSGDTEYLEKAKVIIKENQGQFSHPISDTPLVFKNGRWLTFIPD